ncbi:MAG: FHA domain-containing protein [Chloroflexi bacterium]|nr:FHA domain-containing protein [Chloroflexota bacterium]
MYNAIMWQLVIEALNTPQKRLNLRPGITRIGRASANEIMVDDNAASRFHACIDFKPERNSITLTDLQSTNGTYLNRERILRPAPLKNKDVIRIGQVLLHLENETDARPAAVNTQRYTRALVLESVDNHALLLFEVAQKLNTITDLPTALVETAELVKQHMNAEQCTVMLEKDFERLVPQQYNPELARKAIRDKSAEISVDSIYVPIMAGDELLGLISMMRPRTVTRTFLQRDLQIAVAISHQAALTIQRMRLMGLAESQEQVHRMLLKFVSQHEAESLIEYYSKNGHLPGLKEERVTVLFSDIANSASLAEHDGLREYAQILDSFYRIASEVIFQNGGTTKYLSNGIMAVFSHEMLPDAERRAVETGREMIMRMKPTGSLAESTLNIIGVSINTGPAMVGYVGGEQRVEFNAIGDTVNVAYHMQEYARSFRILAGIETVAALDEVYQHKFFRTIYLRGRESPVDIHEILPE